MSKSSWKHGKYPAKRQIDWLCNCGHSFYMYFSKIEGNASPGKLGYGAPCRLYPC